MDGWWCGLYFSHGTYSPATLPSAPVFSLAGRGHFCWIWAPALGGLTFPAPGHSVCALLQVQMQ